MATVINTDSFQIGYGAVWPKREKGEGIRRQHPVEVRYFFFHQRGPVRLRADGEDN